MAPTGPEDCPTCKGGCPLDDGEPCACECHLAEETPSLGWE